MVNKNLITLRYVTHDKSLIEAVEMKRGHDAGVDHLPNGNS